ncbi:MAG: glycosyltransferase [Candidatus Verstraetearchaeota archaeon]|nr:glycosyltransferase [Candidatus Verstraetearchaeota archaeon]
MRTSDDEMRIGVFFDGYLPLHETKDPGQLVLGFLDLGIQSEMITLYKQELKTYPIRFPFPIRFATRSQILTTDYWRTVPDDVIVAYTWLSRRYLPMVSAMKKAGKFVIVKADSDGRYAFPTDPRRLSFRYLLQNFHLLSFGEIFRRSYHVLRTKLMKRRRIRRVAEHIKLADKVIIESPQAQINLSYSLLYWGFNLSSKIYVVPNPVASDLVNTTVPFKKEKQVMVLGRWDAIEQKNTIRMVKVLCQFANLKPDYDIVIIGSGKEIIQKLISKITSSRIPDQLHLTGYIPRDEVIRHLARSRIFFMPSNWEGFSIAAAEAVCMGCTIVGTPIECLTFLTLGGFSGTIATDFTELPLLNALLIDAHKWEAGYYDPQSISHFWRNNLCRKAIAEKIVRLIDISKNEVHSSTSKPLH